MATPQQRPQPQKNKPATPQARPAAASAPGARPAGAASRQAAGRAKSITPKVSRTLLFDSGNYKWMIGGVALILLGFFLMAGGKSPDPHKFLYDEIYSFRRITLAPMVILVGFFIEVYAIMKKPSAPETKEQA